MLICRAVRGSKRQNQLNTCGIISTSATRSSTRNGLRPAATTTKGSRSAASVHVRGSERCTPPSSKKDTRSSPHVWRTATNANSRPSHGWNGCVTRTVPCATSGSSAVDSAGERRRQDVLRHPDFSPKPRLGACTLAVSDSDRSLRRSRSRCWVHEARGTSPARFWPLRSSAPSRRPARAAVRRSVPRGRQGEEPADARADARIWGDSPIPSRTASREPAQRRDRSPHVLGLPPALGACRPCSRRSLSFVGCAEHQQCSVDEEDQPTSGAQESGCLRDPPIGVAPDAGAVLGDGEVEALVGQRNLLGAAVQQRELEAEFGLDGFAVAS